MLYEVDECDRNFGQKCVSWEAEMTQIVSEAAHVSRFCNFSTPRTVTPCYSTSEPELLQLWTNVHGTLGISNHNMHGCYNNIFLFVNMGIDKSYNGH